MSGAAGYRLDYWAEMAATVMGKYGDEEIGHGAEDALLEEFVCAIADGLVEDPQAAAHALRDGLLKKERSRWYA